MDFVESDLGETPDEVQSTLRFSDDLLAELGSDLSRDEVLAIEALPTGSALLIVKRGANAGARFLLDQDVTTVGRHPNADIFLDDVTVSRRHAEFLRDGIKFTVRDLASLNGTYFDGQRIEQIVVTDGAEVQIGKFRLTFFSSRSDLPQGA